MYVYVIEKGSSIGTQKGKIHNIYTNEESARREMSRLKREYAKSTGDVVTEGVSEFDTEPGVLEGFWFGPKSGNRTACGYRLQKVWAWD